jgi:hypothetical protein
MNFLLWPKLAGDTKIIKKKKKVLVACEPPHMVVEERQRLAVVPDSGVWQRLATVQIWEE